MATKMEAGYVDCLIKSEQSPVRVYGWGGRIPDVVGGVKTYVLSGKFQFQVGANLFIGTIKAVSVPMANSASFKAYGSFAGKNGMLSLTLTANPKSVFGLFVPGTYNGATNEFTPDESSVPFAFSGEASDFDVSWEYVRINDLLPDNEIPVE